MKLEEFMAYRPLIEEKAAHLMGSFDRLFVVDVLSEAEEKLTPEGFAAIRQVCESYLDVSMFLGYMFDKHGMPDLKDS